MPGPWVTAPLLPLIPGQHCQHTGGLDPDYDKINEEFLVRLSGDREAVCELRARPGAY